MGVSEIILLTFVKIRRIYYMLPDFCEKSKIPYWFLH